MMMKSTENKASFPRKLIAAIAVLACVAVGAVGLVLPIIPGLLFLAVAAFIAARHFPSIDARLRRHRPIDRHLGTVDRLRGTPLPTKLQVLGWLGAKALIDGLALVAAAASKLIGALRSAPDTSVRR
jgi:uncharacterized membrane protein YbaN (DUF454 family)